MADEPLPTMPPRIRFEVSLSTLEYAALKRKADKRMLPRTEYLARLITQHLAKPD